MSPLKQPYIVPLLSILFLLIALLVGSSIPDSISRFKTASPAFIDSTEFSRLNLLNKAIQTAPDKPFFNYSSSFENPFRLWNEEPKKAASVAGAENAVPRKRLLLKGILSKNKALAILDNGLGETQIRAVGDTAFNQSVLKITDTSVALRDRFGSYEIVVEDH